MEGRTQQVVSPICGRFRLALLVLIGIVGIARGNARVTEQFIVVEHPARLVIYDQYQRHLNVSESAALGSFVPMQVVHSRDLLGDGLTPCMSVTLNGTPLYLLLEADGHLAGEASAGRISRYDNVVALLDTVTVLRDAALAFEPAGGRHPEHFAKGERIVRVFRDRNHTFVRRTAPDPVYGWAVIEPSGMHRTWDMVTSHERAPSGVTTAIRDSVRSKLGHVNSLLDALYARFNERVERPKAAPHWVVKEYRDSLVCFLRGADSVETFGASTRYLAKDLDNLVLGSGLGVSSHPGRIIISLRYHGQEAR